jgi:hypothetical protein
MKIAAFQAADKARADFRLLRNTPLAAWCGASPIPLIGKAFQIDGGNSLQKKIT